MISKSRELLETRVDVANTEYEIDNINLVKALEAICGKMTMKKTLFILIKKVQIGDNL